MWGSLYVGTKKALVKITTVLARGAKVPYQHSDWGPGKLTLGEVFDREPGDDVIIAINTSHMHRKISGECRRDAFLSERAPPSATDNEPSTEDGTLHDAYPIYCCVIVL